MTFSTHDYFLVLYKGKQYRCFDISLLKNKQVHLITDALFYSRGGNALLLRCAGLPRLFREDLIREEVNNCEEDYEAD